jgi:hypothetical protein
VSHAHSHGGFTGVRAANTLEILSWLTREHLCMSRVDLANIHSLCAYAQEGNTSLILAIIKDNDATAEALIAATASAGALDVQVGGRGKGSALVFASRMGKTGMVEKLLAAGAKAESTDEVKEREPCTQSRWLHWCACCQHP